MTIEREGDYYRFSFYFGGRNVTGTGETFAKTLAKGHELFLKLKQ